MSGKPARPCPSVSQHNRGLCTEEVPLFPGCQSECEFVWLPRSTSRVSFALGVSLSLAGYFGSYFISCLLILSGCRSRGPGSIPALSDFLRSSRSGTGSTQPRECN
jgi:hypothetical protein